MTATILSAIPYGFEGKLIEVECDVSKGLPALQIVGLGNKAIDEARERVRSAINNTSLDYPARRITINLAPASLPKDGAHFDLPIAIAILAVSGQLRSNEVKDSLFAGELALNGDLRPIRGSISIVEVAKAIGVKTVFLPYQNAAQASLIGGIEIVGVKSLRDIFLHLKKECTIPTSVSPPQASKEDSALISIDDIYGQEQAKRALSIAAAGHHNILFSGPPGAGKTMLAKALSSLLPPLNHEEQLIVTKIHNLAGFSAKEIVQERPFRSPHHTASHIALIGGGSVPKPGEVSLAHLGVLFLDELPEYPRSSLEALRQPLEDLEINISRANGQIQYPANFMLVATKNPCPCGYLGDPSKECSCSNSQILAYQKRISGPLLDRIDLIVSVAKVEHKYLLQKENKTPIFQKTQLKVIQARECQIKRYGSSLMNNASVSSKYISQHFKLTPDVTSLLAQAAENLQLSARSYFKIIKVARSIADLESCEDINSAHISEALQYRQL